jgi:hypothetical protein
MAEIVNLRRARKAKAKAEKEKTAEANRVTHGTPKAARDLAKAKTELAAKRLESSRLADDRDEDK